MSRVDSLRPITMLEMLAQKFTPQIQPENIDMTMFLYQPPNQRILKPLLSENVSHFKVTLASKLYDLLVILFRFYTLHVNMHYIIVHGTITFSIR